MEFINNNYHYIIIIFVIIGGYYISLYAKNRRIKRIIIEILEDNNLMKDKTKISVKNKRIVITNYKKIASENLERIPSILTEETGKRFKMTRLINKIRLEQFPKMLRSEGVYSQNVTTGKIKPFKLKELKNWNGVFLAGESGTGKSCMVKALIEENQNIKIYSPKGNKDFPKAKKFSPQMFKEIRELVENYENLTRETWIIIDEILTFISLAKKIDKELLELMSINFSLNRDSKLKYILISQKINKEPLLDISLINYKLINHSEIKNFTKTLGITSIKTRIQSLKTGQFLMFSEEGEFIIQNNIKKDNKI